MKVEQPLSRPGQTLLRLKEAEVPENLDNSQMKWQGCHASIPAWNSFLLDAESTSGSQCGRMD
jgi:hypothetical protein